MKNKIFSTFYWKISGTFLLILIVLVGIFIYININSARRYYMEVNQKLNGDIAKHIEQEVHPFVNGKISKERVSDLMHRMMAVNPSIEIYLLDSLGVIKEHVAPYKKVKLTRVSLGPIKQFINSEGKEFIMGDDPRNPGRKKVFSASPVVQNGVLVGYLYVVLASEEYESASDTLFGSFILKIGTESMLIIVIAAAIIGLLMIWIITKNLNTIIQTVNKFKNGDHSARVHLRSKGEFSALADTFNEMADTTVKNMEGLKGLERLRRELLANVSHDLRTPITSIYGYTETLLLKNEHGEMSKEEHERYLNIILQNTDKLKKLVDELFEFSKLETKQIKFKPEPFSIAELVQDVTGKYKILADKKNIIIESILPENLPLIYADIALVDRAIQNLVDNAIKYTQEGGKVTFEFKQMKNSIEVNIKDTGCGIPEDDLPLIFDRYHKGNNNKENSSGFGLGLAIVKKILELHESFISVKSKLNEGTTFSFNLPLHTS
ncbi:HAMP domain-containing sensor histidine kinase [Fulvivirgaceae bacterium BMA10]|uniref:histidine kinase n=1 Tax=Splendidivirga corallicola TaxID=3051826 RepID=A0ABT8KLX4_9BACT|nr:HAMP domain-containing sensor histidine kinase [Fulvivirgaceae bacterium BMA10]